MLADTLCYSKRLMLDYVPLLARQLELYQLPLGPKRFQAYLDLAVGTSGGHAVDIPPLVLANPMAKDHARVQLEQMLALGIEDLALQTVQEAQKMLDFPQPLKVSTILLDDLKGGWTQRHLNEARDMFQPALVETYQWITLPCWTADPPTLAGFKARAKAYLFRAMYALLQGNPTTLEQLLVQEGRAMAFAGVAQWLEPEDLQYSLEVIRPFLATTHYPTQFVCVFGDKAAHAVGYPPLGLSERAGLAVALNWIKEGYVIDVA